jgi:hypothetical protein
MRPEPWQAASDIKINPQPVADDRLNLSVMIAKLSPRKNVARPAEVAQFPASGE